MAVNVVIWDEGRTKIEISKRYKNCLDSRSSMEDRWMQNEAAIYSTTGAGTPSIQPSLEMNFQTGLPGVDSTISDASMAYTFKNFRFIHAQMSSNPPSVVMRPTSSDQEDHRKADAADRIVRYSIRKYLMQEKIDQLSLQTLLYGTGVVKTVWDSTKGDIIGEETDPRTGEDKVILEGDISVTVPFIWNIHIDPDAKSIDEIKYIMEEIFVDYEEACLRWPDRKDFLKKALVQRQAGHMAGSSRDGKDSTLPDEHYNSVKLIEYWETGLPTNGYLGRYCITTTEGDVIEPCRPSPFRFRRAGAVAAIEAEDIPDEVKEAKIAKITEQASLPYHILTDIDVPNSVLGRSMIEYASHLQDNLNALDSSYLENVRIHGVHRIILPEGADISDDSITDSPLDIIKISGNQPPYYMNPPPLMQDVTQVRNNHIQGINDVMGVNESMFGQQSREQAAAAMQYATNQGNMIRRRLFNKYVITVESIYKAILNLVRKHWVTSRVIHVLGKEKALEAIDIKGVDIDGGYDVIGEYGVSLSLDPITRRQEVITMQPLFEKAGVPARTSLKMMKLAELEGMYDKLDMAGNRQKEIFDEMIATGRYIPPKKFRDHANMIAWALEYFMSSEFNNLPEEVQLLCERHIEERAALAAQEGGGQAAPPPPGPGGMPPMAPPAPAGGMPVV